MLSPVVWGKDQCSAFWNKYIALINVAEENARLRDELRRASSIVNLSAEDRAELIRLRRLLGLEVLHERPAFGARVIAKRFGPHATLRTLTVNKGFLDGAIIGTPVVIESGVVGRVLRTAPRTATILLLTDPGFRLAVISQESRTPGILTGSAGSESLLEVSYVAQNAQISPGEVLITTGMDGAFPKGIPVGVVTQVTPGNEILFLQVRAQPFVDLDRLEEVLLLREDSGDPPLLERLPDPPDSTPLPPAPDGGDSPASPQETAVSNADNSSPSVQERQNSAAAGDPSRIKAVRHPPPRNELRPEDSPAARIEAFQPFFLRGNTSEASTVNRP